MAINYKAKVLKALRKGAEADDKEWASLFLGLAVLQVLEKIVDELKRINGRA